MTAPGALTGLTVVDFTRVFSGPFATQLFGDLGADVIKVERVEGGDEARDYGVTPDGGVRGVPFLAMNRNKRSIGIDLKSEAGRELALRLLDNADVAIHNFRPGVMERLQLDYRTVSERNPRLVYCSISGYGAAGSLRTRAANDLSIQAYSGLLSITGEAGGPPVRNPSSVCDLTAGLYAVIGVLAALQRRQTTGQGEEVCTSMLEGQLSMLNHFLTDYWVNGTVPQRMGTANSMGLPNQAFPTADGWVCITSANERMWRRCCEALDIADLADDPRFVTLSDRYSHREELVEAVSRATAPLTTQDCVTRLDTAGVPCAPVNTIPAIADDPLLDTLEATVEMDAKGYGKVKLVQPALRFSTSALESRLAPPGLGEHTDQILTSIGKSAAEIIALRSSGTVA